MNVMIRETIIVTKMPAVLTLLEVTHVHVYPDTREMELVVMVCVLAKLAQLLRDTVTMFPHAIYYVVP